LRGEIATIERAGDGRLSVTIESDQRPGGTVGVRRLAGSPERHPALVDVQCGDRLAFFGLRPTESQEAYTEAAATTVYHD
jgi:hypothetical protein